MNKRKKSIVEHSLALFVEKGIQNTSVQDIIDRAGISKGTFYNYFSSKTECVSAILEQIRSEANLHRSELLVGKDANDLDLLIEQISVIFCLAEKRGINSIFEEIFYSGDKELKQLALQHKILEYEWLAERLIEVYGEELRPYAFESSVIFYGMLNQLMFMRKITGEGRQDVKPVAASVFHYMQFITQALIHRQTAVLDGDKVASLREYLNHQPFTMADAVQMLKKLLGERELSQTQRDLAQALLTELAQSPLREAVISALLNPFIDAFRDTPLQATVKNISSTVWYCMRQSNLADSARTAR